MDGKLSLFLKELNGRKPAAKAALGLLGAVMFAAVVLFCGAVSTALGLLSAAAEGTAPPRLGLLQFFKAGLLDIRCLGISVCCFIFLTAALLAKYLRSYEPNPVSSQDERGVAFLEKGTYGTSRWMTKEEASERFLTGDIKGIKSTVYGRFEDGSDEVVAYSGRSGGGNRHIMLIGSTGSGKSVSFIRTEIIQSVLRGESVVATDPSAELYTDLADFARSSGAEVKVLNLSSPLNGNGWNCVAECLSPDTGSLDSGRLNDFADIYMRNAGYTGSSDSFWAAAELNLFKAAIGLTAFKRNAELNMLYRGVLGKVLRQGGYSTAQIQEITADIAPEDPVNDILETIEMYAEAAGYDRKLLDASLRTAEQAAPPFTISEVYNTLLAMDDEEKFRDDFLSIPMTHPAAAAYKTYSSREINEKIKASARMGLLNRLQIFNDTSLKGALSVDDLSFPDIGKRQTVLFIITPDKTDTFKPISSLAFSFLFKDLSDEWDREQARSQKEGRKNNRIPVSVIMDEFYSVGSIPSFPVFIATCRKRLLNITVSLQNIGQLYDLYGDNGGDTILSCCDTLLFMGCNDLTTAQFVSAFCAGEATVKSQSFRTPNGLVATLTQAPEQRVGVSESARRLITPDEVRRFTNGVLVVARGEQPLKLKRYPYFEHPVSKAGLLRKSNVYEIPSLLRKHCYRDSFSGLTLKDIVDSSKPVKKTGAKASSVPQDDLTELEEDMREMKKKVLRKADFVGLLAAYPAGSSTPIEIDWSDESQFLGRDATVPDGEPEREEETGIGRNRRSRFY